MKRFKSNENFFSVIDSEEKAYLLGMFLADGYIRMNARCTNSWAMGITLWDYDSYIINWFKEYICPGSKILVRPASKERRETHHIKWTSNETKKDLEEKYNIIERKTNDIYFKMNFENIPYDFLWDFIRGFMDGDGHISYSDITHQFTFAFYSTSEPFMKQLGEIFEEGFNVKYIIDSTIKTHMRLYCLRFNCDRKRGIFISKLYEKLYTNKKLFMIRKKEKIEKYLMFKYRVNSWPNNHEQCNA